MVQSQQLDPADD